MANNQRVTRTKGTLQIIELSDEDCEKNEEKSIKEDDYIPENIASTKQKRKITKSVKVSKKNVKKEKDDLEVQEKNNLELIQISDDEDYLFSPKKKFKSEKNTEELGKRSGKTKTFGIKNNSKWNKPGPSKVIEKENEDLKNKNLKIKQEIVDVKQENVSYDLNKSVWEDFELLAEMQNIEKPYAFNIVKMFKEGATIPFMARYRQCATGNLDAEYLREAKENFDKIQALKEKQQSVIKAISKVNEITPDLENSILCSKNLEEIEHLYAPYKSSGKRTLAERAKALGLEKVSLKLLQNEHSVDLKTFIKKDIKELSTISDVENGVIHLIAHKIANDFSTLVFLRELRQRTNFRVEVKKLQKKSIKIEENKKFDENKYDLYIDFKSSILSLKPHQILAINRGEAVKMLSVKIIIPDFIYNQFHNFCHQNWVVKGKYDENRIRILNEAIKDAYNRLVTPLLTRQLRSELKLRAENAGVDVFSKNLKQLLLTKPLKGRPILGIDPGYKNGCKCALINNKGNLVAHNIIYPHLNRSKDVEILKDMLYINNCNLIALGNGTACRETESWLSDLISNRVFTPLDVTYTIVNEAGVSIYSCGSEAKKEFPNLEPNIISAVSLARRIQEPLAEYVKVEPKHLGIGMYQHDLPKKQLDEALNEIISECVSFVGVDLNTTSQCLLKHVAGLTDKRASSIIEHRESKGMFLSRKDLMNVKGIGPKIFEQCAGFLRVGPTNESEEKHFYRDQNTNRLDRTDIHPESYEVTLKIIKKKGLNIKDIGSVHFTSAISKLTELEKKKLCEEFEIPKQTAELIFNALSKPLNYDFRNEVSQVPLFKKSITTMSELKVGTVIIGKVNNVCDFGAFVDIGVEKDGLMHVKCMNGLEFQVGDVVEVKIINLDIVRGRIGLAAVEKF